MTNKSIRVALITNELKQWQLAKLLGMHEAALSRKLRFELPPEEQKRIIEIICQAKGGKMDVEI